jgi:hypothetical protein
LSLPALPVKGNKRAGYDTGRNTRSTASIDA